MDLGEKFALYDAQMKGGQMHAIWLVQALFYLLTADGTLAASAAMAAFGKGLTELEDYLADPDPEKEFQAASSVHHQRLELFRTSYRTWAIGHGFLKPDSPVPDFA
ncbi:MAG: hypothetical protein B7Y36_18915 [Novosphingobium sp. 28-62-57]|uniref:hypothetical protein n=1 Tax=Novosphingobium sp. 28-62-57 TaxID=1970409 RepID=UPI000BCFF54D|nr:hypothetical protein [Novosphingobium sp. 28-62-57]OYW50929.1 MAG: hypothetical protein B7Z34_03720 [Novosphingobium sp. 12-62-10]OYZ07745.1 MAG: hypothetical protein B7Y36_18915 [Novosphingobium sp. 28-62-57]HQS71095.1 hypothetical protein [Novosphingobium sp.]